MSTSTAGDLTPRASRSFADDIRARSDVELARLLQLRPDLARPAPADLTSLAARAGTPASTQRMLGGLDLGHWQALEGVLVAAARGPEVSGGAVTDDVVAALLGVATDDLTPLLRDLWSVGALWWDGAGWRVARPVAEAVGEQVTGLAAPSVQRPRYPEDSSVPDMAALLALAEDGGIPDAARAVLDSLAWGPPQGRFDPDGRVAEGVAWLAERGLLVPREGHTAVLPRDVALAWRGGRIHREPRLAPEPLPALTLPSTLADAGAGEQAGSLLGHLEELGDLWALTPPGVLRSGGLAVRELARTATALSVDAPRAAFLVELALAAGLLADDGTVDPVWAPTSRYDDWLREPPSHRWALLVRSWLGSTRAAHLVGRGVNALGPDASWPAIRALRVDLLTELMEVPIGQGTEEGALRERLSWRRPTRAGSEIDAAWTGIITEAEWLGLLAHGVRGALALTGPGRAAISHASGGTGAEADLVAAMDDALPAPVTHVLLQADLTAVAPGRLEPEAGRFLRLAAEIESRGAATVYRFTEASLVRALDAGWSADELLRALGELSSTPVPQPLSYLIGDLARRHGASAVGAAESYLRSDDETLLAAVLAGGVRVPGLRRLAPTVLVSEASPQQLLAALREAGFTPAVESATGTVGGAGVASGGHGTSGPVGRRARPRRGAPESRGLAPLTLGGALGPVGPTGSSSAGGALLGAARSGSALGSASAGAYAQLIAELRAGESTRDQLQERARAASAAGVPSIPAQDPSVMLATVRTAIAAGEPVWIAVADPGGETRRHLFHPTRVDGGRVSGLIDDSPAPRAFSVHRLIGAVTADASPTNGDPE